MMSDDVITTQVRSASIGTPGRALTSARGNHLIVDSPTIGEAITSGEMFLAGVSSCGVTLVESQAQRSGVPLSGLTVAIEGVRRADKANEFQKIALRFELTGVNQEQAEQLVGVYQDT
jgi:uncharacterized OsmC-like protein